MFLKSGARGVPSRSPLSSTSSSPYQLKSNTMNSELFEKTDSTIIEMDTPDLLLENSSGNRNNRSLSPGGRPLVYRFSIGSVESFERKLEETQRELGIAPRNFVPVQYSNESNWKSELLTLVPSMLMLGILYYFGRQMMGGVGGPGGGGGGLGNVFKIGKSPARKIKKEDIKVTFADVAGCDEAKKEIMEFVDFLKDSERFTKLGAKIPKGALLCGPPVCTGDSVSCALLKLCDILNLFLPFSLYLCNLGNRKNTVG